VTPEQEVAVHEERERIKLGLDIRLHAWPASVDGPMDATTVKQQLVDLITDIRRLVEGAE
jgi:hypothetical protein